MPANHYSYTPQNAAKSCKARGVDLRTHFKNMREVAAAVRGMGLRRAQRYLANVIRKREIVPFRVYDYGISRKAQVKNHYRATQGGWPEKSCRYLLDVLRNGEANAEAKQLDLDRLVITHIAVQRAQKQRRRTYRAHGRINPFMSNPCHIELVLTEKEKPVKKAPEPAKKKKKAAAPAAQP